MQACRLERQRLHFKTPGAVAQGTYALLVPAANRGGLTENRRSGSSKHCVISENQLSISTDGHTIRVRENGAWSTFAPNTIVVRIRILFLSIRRRLAGMGYSRHVSIVKPATSGRHWVCAPLCNILRQIALPLGLCRGV